MLGPGWVVATATLTIASLLWRDVLLFLIALTLLTAAAVSRTWQRHCLDRVEYRRALSHRRVAFGDAVELTVEVVNRKLLPLAWLELQDEVPRALQPARASIAHSYKPGRALLTGLFSLRPYERVRRRYRLHCEARGEYAFGPATLRSGDVFGFETREQIVPTEQRLLVYPRIVPVGQLGLSARDPLGDRRVRDWLFEDPAYLVGLRDYRPGDSSRRVHWAATARTGSLQVKVFQPTTDLRLLVLLNVETLGSGWWRGYDPALLELAISVAASVVAWGVEDGRSVGLSSNATQVRTAGSIAIPPSRDPDQLTDVLTALARAMPLAQLPFDRFLDRERGSIPYGTTLAVVSATLGERVAAELQALRIGGHRVVLFLVGAHPRDNPLPGIRAHVVSTLPETLSTAS